MITPFFPLVTLFFSTSVMFRWAIQAYAMCLEPLSHFNIPTMNVIMFGKCQHSVPLFRELPKLSDAGHQLQYCVNDYRGCSHLCPDYIMGHQCLAPYKEAIIEINVSQYSQLFAYPQESWAQAVSHKENLGPRCV